jgi:hypothetical protein
MVVSMKNIPAFPQATQIANEFHPNYGKDAGMTLRDYFAAKALSSPQAPTISLMTLAEGRDVIDPWPCEWAYKVADAMLKARQA